jgi:signal transduction histidine kinase/DNA-binding response OmpR family regulator
MALRLNSLKTRTAVAMSSVIVAILLVNAIYLILTKRAELRRDIEDRATTFALLTRQPICVGYETYYASGFYKFRELMRDYMRLNRDDVKRILIVSVSGQILFDSAELDEGAPRSESAPERRIEDPARLEAVKRLEHTVLRGRGPNGEETLEIVAPYLEDWGRHKMSVSYIVSYDNLGPSITKLVWATGGLTLLSMLASIMIAVALATRITRPLEELTAGAKDIAEGHFDRRLDIRSNDELTVLADGFNHMAARLKENVEQLEESNKRLAAVNEELKELDRMKSDLLANVSHELRTPLTAIKGYTDYILERKLGPITDKQEKGLVVVQRNLERLSKTINALLDFSRMEMGRMTLSIHPFSLPQLVDQIHTTIRSELDKKRLTFGHRIDPGLPPVIADREKVSAVLENLLINATKFTTEGGRITLVAHRVMADGRPCAEIRVSDTGVGIPRDQLGKIFNRFHQVDGSATRRFGGVGLGLAIVKSILDAHGTSIEVESEEGRGTTFRFTLPLLEKADDRSSSDELRTRDRAEEGLILVVDDEPDVLRLMRKYLEDEGFSVVTASTAAEGAAAARGRRPDVILLDLMLPDRSGFDLLETLKKDAATASIPVMVVSIMNDAVRGLTLGASEYLVKPVERGAITSTVRRLLDGRVGGDPTVLVVDDEIDTAELLRDTLRAEGFRAQVAHHGRQALELIARKRPDLVILDIMMPGLSGFEVLEALRRDPQTASIPVLVLTARGEAADQKRGLDLGAKRYINKPFDVRALITEVRRHLGQDVPVPGAPRAIV